MDRLGTNNITTNNAIGQNEQGTAPPPNQTDQASTAQAIRQSPRSPRNAMASAQAGQQASAAGADLAPRKAIRVRASYVGPAPAPAPGAPGAAPAHAPAARARRPEPPIVASTPSGSGLFKAVQAREYGTRLSTKDPLVPADAAAFAQKARADIAELKGDIDRLRTKLKGHASPTPSGTSYGNNNLETRKSVLSEIARNTVDNILDYSHEEYRYPNYSHASAERRDEVRNIMINIFYIYFMSDLEGSPEMFREIDQGSYRIPKLELLNQRPQYVLEAQAQMNQLMDWYFAETPANVVMGTGLDESGKQHLSRLGIPQDAPIAEPVPRITNYPVPSSTSAMDVDANMTGVAEPPGPQPGPSSASSQSGRDNIDGPDLDLDDYMEELIDPDYVEMVLANAALSADPEPTEKEREGVERARRFQKPDDEKPKGGDVG